MLTLDLTSAPRWHDLAPGVQVQLRPLATALMVATRSDPAVEVIPENASDEERAVAVARALLLDAEKTALRPCRMVLRWGRRLLRGLWHKLSRLSLKAEPAAYARRRAGLGPGAAPRRADAPHPGRGDRLGHDGGARTR
jgi:hypothetical protein